MKKYTKMISQFTVYFDSIANSWDRWQARNQYYHENIKSLLRFLIPQGFSVLEIGCATGDLLAAVRPMIGIGVDISPAMIELARKKYQQYSFYVMNAEELSLRSKI